MKRSRTFTAAAVGVALAFAPVGNALADRKHHDSHDGHRTVRVQRSYSYYGNRPYYGYSWYRPWWYRPAVSFTYIRRPDYYSYDDYGTVYRGRSVEAEVQRALARRGYYRGPIDGDIGPGSRAAIRAYQVDRGLRVTGYIDSSLLRSLRL